VRGKEESNGDWGDPSMGHKKRLDNVIKRDDTNPVVKSVSDQMV
jgi:hypothetical protein